MSGRSNNNPMRIVGIYLLFSLTWITVSDRVLGIIFTSPKTIANLGMIKVWVFVLLTAALLYRLVSTAFAQEKRAEAEQRAILERLRQAEKLEAIGLLAGGVAHDFNNQLTGIMGYGELLAEGLKDPALREYAEKILGEAARSRDLTQSLLAFARKGKFQTIPVDLNNTVSDLADQLKRTVDRRISVRYEAQDQPSLTLGDPAQLRNAILQLTLNAADAMPDGGELRLMTEEVQLEKIRALRPGDLIPAGRYTRISVEDTGTGMTNEIQRRIFEPFFTTKDLGKGIGMGLPAVYGTMKSHSGYVDFRSEPGAGSIFELYFPVPGSFSNVDRSAPRVS